MRRDNNQQKIALAVGIALSAGVFSIMPSASAAPVLDHVVSGGAVVDQKSTPNVTEVSSTTRNNVVDWKDFSVAKGETVRFDGGEKINNYMNVVSGANTSHIDGAIKGGNNVYIVNPNGVVFGSSASVDVGSLYVSSRPLDKVNYDKVDANGDMQPLADTASMGGGDIVNMGTVQANSVFVEGGNIILADVDRIKTADGSAVNNNVTIQTQGEITLGRSVSAMVAEEKANRLKASNVRSSASTANTNNSLGGNYRYTANRTTRNVGNISNETELDDVRNNLAGSYIMVDDVTITADSWTPIGTKNNAFTGTFNGQYHTVSGINVTGGTYGGLFGYTKDAKIENVGVVGGSVNASCAGGIAGYAANTTFKNVFNEGTRIGDNTSFLTYGGIVGEALNSTIDTAYNTADIGSTNTSAWQDVFDAGGIVGKANGTTIMHVYNTGTVANGIVGSSATNGGNTLKDAYYTNGVRVHSSDFSISEKENVIETKVSSGSYSLTDYDGKLSSITNVGSNADADTVVWRIYEGQTLPLLRAFLLKGGNAVTVNYSYTHGDDQSGSNNGADLTANSVTAEGDKLTYNGSYMEVTNFSVGDNDKDLIQYSNEGTRGVRNATTKALFYTGQQGYELIGNNVTMAKRQVSVFGDDFDLSKVYDGKADATKAFKTAFESSNGSGTAGGILAADANYVNISYKADDNGNAFSVKFADNTAQGIRGKDVGEDKTVNLVGKLGLSASDLDGAAEIYANYELAEDSKTLTGKTIKGTITPRTLLLKIDPTTGIDKTYDGSAEVSEDYSPDKVIKLDETTAGVDDDGNVIGDSGLISGDSVKLKSNGSTAYYVDNGVANANAGNHDVLYTGVALDTENYADGKNYVLKYQTGTGTSASTEDVTDGQVLLAGTINRRLILSDGFTVNGAAATKVYNGDSSYTVPVGATLTAATAATGDTTGIIAADQPHLKFSLNENGSTYFVAADGTTPAQNVATAKYVAYAVDVTAGKETVNGTVVDYAYLLKNYKLGTTSSATDLDSPPADGFHVTGEGTITRRELSITAENARDINKPYDGSDEIIKDDSSYTTMGGKVKYVENSLEKVNDGTGWNITAKYDGADVARNDDWGVDDNSKNVNFYVNMTGDATNYTLNGVEAENYTAASPLPLTGAKGRIDPAIITPTFNKITKTYDGTTAIVGGDATTSEVTFTGKVGNDDVDIDYKTDAEHAYFNSPNVADANKVTYIDVKLKGEQKQNYDLAATVVNGVATGDGEIKRRLILSDSFTVNGQKASKVYDGKSDYTLDPNATLTSVLDEDGNTGVVTADQAHLHFKLSTNGTSYFTEADGINKAKDVAKAKKVAYAVDATTDKNYEYLLGNYKLGADAESATELDDTSTGLHVTGKGEITRRILSITSEGAQDVNKTYDTNETVKNEKPTDDYFTMGSKVKYAAGSDELVSDKDGIPTWSITAAYVGADVYRKDNNPDGEVVTNGKDVTFNVSLTGTNAANYTIKTPTNTTGVNAEDTATTPLALGAKGTITPKSITPEFTKLIKTYNDSRAINDGDASPNPVTYTLAGNLDGDNVTVSYSTDLKDSYFATANVCNGNETVTYGGLALGGDKRGNYQLSSNTVKGAGQIKAKALNDENVDIQFNTIKKVYDASTSVAYNHKDTSKYFGDEVGSKTANDFVKSITIGGVTMVYGVDYTINETDTVYTNANVGTKNVTYKFNLISGKLSNFSFDGLSENLYKDGVITKTTTGTIEKKQLQATVTVPKVIEKLYDGDDNLPSLSTANSPKVTVAGLVDSSDKAYFDNTQLNGRYADKNVARDTDGTVINKDLLFDIVVKGENSGNYKINDTDEYQNSPSTLKATVKKDGMGKINPVKLTADFAYTERVYNGTSDAPVAGVTLNGLVNNETLTLNNITGTFVDENGKTDGNVNYVETADGKAGYKGVKYTGLQAALANAAGGNNYSIDDMVYYSQKEQEEPGAVKRGRITRLPLGMDDIKSRWDEVTKIYDGDDKAPTGKLHIYTDVLDTTTDKSNPDKWVDLAYTLKDDGGAVYDNKQVNVGSGLGVTYTVNGLAAKEFENYAMTDELLNSFTNEKPYHTTGSITPRILNINLSKSDGWVKTYDGGTTVKAADGTNSFDYKFNSSAESILAKDKENGVSLVITGAYENATANIDPWSKEKTGKIINYTVKLTGNDAGNYALNEDNIVDGKGLSEQTDATTYMGNGAIKKRMVYVDFTGDYGSGIDKQYDGNNSADAGKEHRNSIDFVPAGTNTNTGLLDSGITLNYDAIDAHYQSKDVARDKKTKNVIAQDVNFTGFELQGDDKKDNYVVRADDGTTYGSVTLKGSGTITPIKVTVALKDDYVPSKDYDGTNAVDAVYKDNNNFILTPETVVGKEKVANYIAVAATFDDVNAGSPAANYADKSYTYTLTMKNSPNYELVAGNDGENRMVTVNQYGQQATLKGTDGTITPRTVSVNKIADMIKVYDGTLAADADYMNNIEQNIGLKNVVNNDNLGLSVTAAYNDNPNAGKSANSDELQKHKVKYTLNLSNPNYQLADDSRTVYGNGYITRQGLVVTVNPASMNAGEALPKFTGTVTGFISGDQNAYRDFVNGLSFRTEAGTATTSPGQYAVYGWYRGNKAGLAGLNYTFVQDAANDTALTVNYVNNNTGNPDTKITPNGNIYHQISKDMNSGFGDNGAAAIEYKDKSGKVIAKETIDSGEIHGAGLEMGNSLDDTSNDPDKPANIGIAGGDIVNMEGADAAGIANIEVSGDGTTVNLEVYSVQDKDSTGLGNSAAEITNADSRTGLASIEITDEKHDILGEENEDKIEKEKKEGKIAIKSSNGEDDDEIELTVEKQGVNVA